MLALCIEKKGQYHDFKNKQLASFIFQFEILPQSIFRSRTQLESKASTLSPSVPPLHHVLDTFPYITEKWGVGTHFFFSGGGGVAPHQFVPFCAKRATGRSPPTSKWCTIFRAYPPSHFLKFSNIQQWYQSAKRSLCETKNYFILYTCLSLLFPFIILVLSVEVPLFTYLDTQVYICATFNSIFVPCLFWVNEHQPFHVCFVPL